MVEHTTAYDMTLAKATMVANSWTKCLSIIDGSFYTDWRVEYNTAIKGESADERYPEECWAVSNRYDPRVSKGD